VAATRIAPGERFTAATISIKRPGTGISPMQYWRILEEHSQHAYIPDQLL
jgi:N-acetylneuraminate synthase